MVSALRNPLALAIVIATATSLKLVLLKAVDLLSDALLDPDAAGSCVTAEDIAVSGLAP